MGAERKYMVKLNSKGLERVCNEFDIPLPGANSTTGVYNDGFLLKIQEFNSSQDGGNSLNTAINLTKIKGYEPFIDHVSTVFDNQKTCNIKSLDVTYFMYQQELLVDFKSPHEVGANPRPHKLLLHMEPINLHAKKYKRKDFIDAIQQFTVIDEESKQLVRKVYTVGKPEADGTVTPTQFVLDPYDIDMCKLLPPSDYEGIRTLRSIAALVSKLTFKENQSGVYTVRDAETLLTFLLDVAASGDSQKDNDIVFTFYELRACNEGILENMSNNNKVELAPNAKLFNKQTMMYLYCRLFIKYTDLPDDQQKDGEGLVPIDQDYWNHLVRHYRQVGDEIMSEYESPEQFDIGYTDINRFITTEYPDPTEDAGSLVVDFSGKHHNPVDERFNLNWLYLMKEDYSLSLIPSCTKRDMLRRFNPNINPLAVGQSFTQINDPVTKYCDNLFMMYVKKCQDIYRALLLPANRERAESHEFTSGALYERMNQAIIDKWWVEIGLTKGQAQELRDNLNRQAYVNAELIQDYMTGFIPLFAMNINIGASVESDIFSVYKNIIKRWLTSLAVDYIKDHKQLQEALGQVAYMQAPVHYLSSVNWGTGDKLRFTAHAQVSSALVETNSIYGSNKLTEKNTVGVHLSVNFILVESFMQSQFMKLDSVDFIKQIISYYSN